MAGRLERRVGELYSEHFPWAVRVSYLLVGDRELAEDLAHDAFVRMFGRFEDIRHSAAFKSYLRRTLVNLATDRFRRKELERATAAKDEASGRIAVDEPPDVATRHTVAAHLQSLPRRQRVAIILRYFEDLSEQQVADEMGVSASAIKSLVHRGLHTLRADMGGTWHE